MKEERLICCVLANFVRAHMNVAPGLKAPVDILAKNMALTLLFPGLSPLPDPWMTLVW